MTAFAVRFTDDDWTSCANCGVEFASAIVTMRRSDGKTFYCPNGHNLHFGDTEAKRLKRQIEQKDNELANIRRDLEWQRSQRATSEKRRIAQKAQTTKARNQLKRVKNGVCPCCNRTFQNLMRHMETKHPSFQGAEQASG